MSFLEDKVGFLFGNKILVGTIREQKVFNGWLHYKIEWLNDEEAKMDSNRKKLLRKTEEESWPRWIRKDEVLYFKL